MNINFDIKNLECFITVAELLNFHKAAEKLYISQPALSRRIQKLERFLDVELFTRKGKRVELTVEGQDFYKRAYKIVNEIEYILNDYKNYHISGETTLNIACVPSLVLFFIPDILKVFNHKFPQVKVVIHDIYATEIRNIIESGIADIGISFELSTHEHDSFIPLATEHFVLVIHKDNPLKNKQIVTWKDIKNERYIAIWKGSRNRSIIDTKLLKYNRTIKPFYEVRHASTALGIIAKNLGVSILPYSTLPPQNEMNLIYKNITKPTITRNLGIIVNKNNKLSKTGEIIINEFSTIAREIANKNSYLRLL